MRAGAVRAVQAVAASVMGWLERLRWWGGGARHEASVLVVGLDGSGKTSLLQALRPRADADAHGPRPGPPRAAPQPTISRRLDRFHALYIDGRNGHYWRVVENKLGGGVSFSAWDVGGAGRQRALWDHQYRCADAFVFVVDCADHLRLVVARDELELLLAHPDVRGRRAPLLVFANKSDASGALTAPQTAAALGLSRLADRPWHVCASSALSGHGLHEGVAWLARELREQHRHSGN